MTMRRLLGCRRLQMAEKAWFFSTVVHPEMPEQQVRELVSKALGSAGTLQEVFFDLEAYRLALSDVSLLDGERKRRFERQEYLGDAIVGLAVARQTFAEFPESDEGVLTDMRRRLASRPTLAFLAKRLDFDTFKAEDVSQRRLADAYESFVGARFLDAAAEFKDDGRAYAAASDFVVGTLKKFAPVYAKGETGPDIRNYKGILNDICLKWSRMTPVYFDVDKYGDPPHFVVEVSAAISYVVGKGEGPTKSRAHQVAARDFLLRLRDEMQAKQQLLDADDPNGIESRLHRERVDLIKLSVLDEDDLFVGS